jgi:hypothetical protein
MDFAHAYLLSLTALSAYVTGVSAMTTRVSYPLYAAVPAGAFVDYHARYNRQIPPVVIAPAFAAFLGWLSLPLIRPAAVPVGVALTIAAGGLIALVATATAAIPSHLRLQREGFSDSAYGRLRTADRIRTAACVLGAVLLAWSVVLAFTPR